MRSRSFMGQLGCLMGLGLLLGACEGVVNVGGGGGGPLPKADKVDLLLVVDNSRSMADKQEILARALSDLVQSLANPPCIDEHGNISGAPADPQAACPPGQMRRHAPVTDIHVGVISTSIGGHGSDSCPDVDTASFECSPNPNLTNNDKGHLLSRTDVCGNAEAPTYQDMGFLVWDPKGKQSPPGTSNPVELAQNLSAMVRGVGQSGCGYESQLESWYRFLVDPEPYESISVSPDDMINLVVQGTDDELLAQRTSFLRPDSMLVILSLTDENDCSINETGQNYLAAQLRTPGNAATQFRLPRARAVCATNPNDPCCFSCGQDQNQNGCPADPTCIGPDGQVALLDAAEDSVNLRCLDQKRRFGIDFLYPVDRYVDALTQPMIPNRAGDLVKNPLFSDLDPSDGTQTARDPGLVFMASISGVPWQAIARNPQDLSTGYMNATELEQNGTWDAILGDPSAHVPPTNPYMVESIAKRAGITAGNEINGGDHTISENNDLQYACTFPLSTPRDCSDQINQPCDCGDPNNDNPLCNGTMQIAAKAYPSLRTMSVIKGIGDQGVLTSICPAELTDATAPDYAYRPVIGALLERMATRL